MNDAGQSFPGELLAVPPRDEPAQGSDDLELDRLMGVYRPYLTGLAEKLVLPPLRGRIDRSDLVQEALVRGFAQRDQFRGTTEAEFSAWLKQILQNVAVDWARHHTAGKRDVNRETAEGREFVSQAETPSQNCSRQEEMARVAVAMSRLSDDQRSAVELRSKGLSFREIGEATRRSEDAARMLWGRGLARLVELLGIDDKSTQG